MKEEWINSFLAPAKLVWQKELGQALELAGAHMVSNQYATDDITAIISVSGQLQGNVLYGFSEETTKSIISVMVGEDSAPVSNEFGLSAIGEIAEVQVDGGQMILVLGDGGMVSDELLPDLEGLLIRL